MKYAWNKISRYFLIAQTDCEFVWIYLSLNHNEKTRLSRIAKPWRLFRHCLKFQVSRGPFKIRPAANMMRARGYVRYHWDRDMKRETGKRERRRRISHRKVPSVVLFQVCIRFVFQPIILTKSSALPLFLSAQNARASKKNTLVQKNTLARKDSRGT